MASEQIPLNFEDDPPPFTTEEVTAQLEEIGEIERYKKAAWTSERIARRTEQVRDAMSRMRRNPEFQEDWDRPEALCRLALARIPSGKRNGVRLDGNGTWD